MSVVLPPAPATGRARPQQNPLEAVLKALASLRLTVVLLALGCFLVFVGTIAQIDGGIWTIVRDYFRSFLVWVPFKLFAQLGQIFAGWPKDASAVGGAFPFPGGWTIGTLMLINLVAAHATRFRFQANRLGIIAIHTGLVVLMLGELMAGLFQIESRMTIGHGETVGFVEDSRAAELAIIDPADPNTNAEVTIPESMLTRLGKITHEKLPVDLEVVEWFPNAELQPLQKGMPSKDVFVSKQGVPFTLFRKGEGSGVDPASHDDAASARINIYKKGTSELIGTKVVSLWLTPNFTKRIPSFQFPPQEFTADGKTYQIELRGRRDYLPFTLRLNEFSFDRYPGTNIPKNYSSRVTLSDPRTNANRDVLVRMNEPLAYEGATYYQSGFTPDEKGTVLQATRNPGVWLPYISCVLMSVGMLVHFGQKLFAFLTRGAGAARSAARASSPASLRPSNVWIIAGAGAALVIGGIAWAARPKPVPAGGFDYEAFAKLPCLDGGRVKPLDTVARVALTVINTKQTVVDPAGRPVSPIQWLLDVMTLQPANVDKADIAQIPFFRIDNLDVVQQLGFENRPGVFRYSLKELKPKFDLIEKDADRADDIDSKKRSLADQKIIDLRRHLMEFLRLNSLRLAVLPPESGGAVADWKVVGDYTPDAIDRQALATLRQQAEQGKFDPKSLTEEQLLKLIREQRDRITAQTPESARAFLAILGAYQANDPRRFNEAVAAFAGKYGYHPAGESLRRVDVEQWYNRAAPFFHLMFDYLLAAMVVFVGWLLVSGMPKSASACFAAGVGMTAGAFAVHIVALLARMYLMDRPLVFVTNLYSSALFIAACAAGVGLLVEWMYGRGIGIALGAATAAAGLFVGYSIDLGVEGDKLEMLQAVLDTNFWLATHVTTVTFGYAATFLAGGVGLAYVLLGVCTHVLADTNLRKMLAGLIYGLVAFATLLSFVGTVLGGIWADYSWGRFWGWDPKENGAMLIVLWNALVLHARWGGLVKAHGVAVLSICGIAVTAWSWFGTNQLGVGLHSYGFTSAAAQALFWLAVGVAVSAAVGCLPERMWLSATPGKTKSA